MIIKAPNSVDTRMPRGDAGDAPTEGFVEVVANRERLCRTILGTLLPACLSPDAPPAETELVRRRTAPSGNILVQPRVQTRNGQWKTTKTSSSDRLGLSGSAMATERRARSRDGQRESLFFPGVFRQCHPTVSCIALGRLRVSTSAAIASLRSRIVRFRSFVIGRPLILCTEQHSAPPNAMIRHHVSQCTTKVLPFSLQFYNDIHLAAYSSTPCVTPDKTMLSELGSANFGLQLACLSRFGAKLLKTRIEPQVSQYVSYPLRLARQSIHCAILRSCICVSGLMLICHRIQIASISWRKHDRPTTKRLY